MMRLLRSWRDSLLLLLPQNLKLFALVTLKSTIETYKVLARVWYLWLIPILVPVVLKSYLGSLGPTKFITFFDSLLSHGLVMLLVSISAWLTIITCLASRPSTGQKNLNYFKSYFPFFCMIAFVLIVFSFDYFLWSWLHWYSLFSVKIATDYNSLWIFFVLFFLDSDGSIKELWTAGVRAVKMTIYNLPLILILVFLLSFFTFIMAFLVSMLTKHMIVYRCFNYIWPLFSVLLLKPLLINIWTNIYIKKLHEMPDLYFNQPK